MNEKGLNGLDNKNHHEVRGKIIETAAQGPNNSLVFVVRTEENIKNNRYVTLHKIRVYSDELKKIVLLANKGDFVSVSGPKSPTQETIALYYENLTYALSPKQAGVNR